MNPPRKLTRKEIAVISTLLKSTPDTVVYDVDLEKLHATAIDDGGMGSLRLIPQGSPGVKRKFGKQIVSSEFMDSDGVMVSMTINVDRDNLLYELDVWKVDFSPLLNWPDPSAVRVIIK